MEARPILITPETSVIAAVNKALTLMLSLMTQLNGTIAMVMDMVIIKPATMPTYIRLMTLNGKIPMEMDLVIMQVELMATNAQVLL